jgi:hypothetical protein
MPQPNQPKKPAEEIPAEFEDIGPEITYTDDEQDTDGAREAPSPQPPPRD